MSWQREWRHTSEVRCSLHLSHRTNLASMQFSTRANFSSHSKSGLVLFCCCHVIALIRNEQP